MREPTADAEKRKEEIGDDGPWPRAGQGRWPWGPLAPCRRAPPPFSLTEVWADRPAEGRRAGGSPVHAVDTDSSPPSLADTGRRERGPWRRGAV